MKLLVFGKTGQVAKELQKAGPCMALGRDEADLRNPQACAQAVFTHRPNAVINAAAFTAVDRAETQEAAASVINGEAPAAMADAAARLGIPFLHISTDYVFDGAKDQPRMPDDIPAPINAYGRSKLAGEAGVVAAGGTYAILRTAWVFSAHGSNFVKTMYRLGNERSALSVVEDQVGGPTPAAGIAAALLTMAGAMHKGGGKSGIYHYAGTPAVSWKAFAEEIFSQTGQQVTLTGITTANYPAPAARPLNSRLDCRSLATVFGIPQPDWRSALVQVLTELEAVK